MNDEEFQKYVLEKLDCIDKKLIRLHERIGVIEGQWSLIKRVVWVILAAIAAKYGIDLSGVH